LCLPRDRVPQGCSLALAALIEAIQPEPGDTIVTLGDYINRCQGSPGALNQLIVLGQQCELVPLMGNHEEMLLSALKFSLQSGCIADEGEAHLARQGTICAGLPCGKFPLMLSCFSLPLTLARSTRTGQ
jgi:hypothetical protein